MKTVQLALVFSLSLFAAAAAQGVAPRALPAQGAAGMSRIGPAVRNQAAASAAGCSGHGRLLTGLCACDPGWSGASCQAPAGSICSGHGTRTANGACICSTFWMGPDCSMAGLSITGPVFPQ